MIVPDPDTASLRRTREIGRNLFIGFAIFAGIVLFMSIGHQADLHWGENYSSEIHK